MTPAEANRVVQATKWHYVPEGNIPGKDRGPMLIGTITENLTRAARTLGIDVDGDEVIQNRCKGGESYSFTGSTITTLIDAGAVFPQRNELGGSGIEVG